MKDQTLNRANEIQHEIWELDRRINCALGKFDNSQVKIQFSFTEDQVKVSGVMPGDVVAEVTPYIIDALVDQKRMLEKEYKEL